MFLPSHILEDTMHRYSIPSMTCGHCAGTIDHAVKGIDPQAEVTIDLKTKQVYVRSATAEAEIVRAIRSAGYVTVPVMQ
jgi:copper chaperone